MNRAFFIVLVPAVVVAIGYVLVLRAIGLEPPYWKLGGIVAALGLAFWWLGKKHKRNQEVK